MKIEQLDQDSMWRAKQGFMLCDRLHHSLIEKRVNDLLHRSQHMVLVYLERNGGSATQKDISGFFKVSPAAMTVTVQKLERMGYVARKAKEADNRSKDILLTAAGKGLLSRTKAMFDEIDGAMFSGFSQIELEQMIDFFSRMEKNLRHKEAELESNAPRQE